jgi:hypothetical protein
MKAVDFIRGTMGIQSSNRMDDPDAGQSKEVRTIIRDMMTAKFNANIMGDNLPVTSGFSAGALGKNYLLEMEQVASWASALMAHPVGTCDAFASLALTYLVEKTNSLPLVKASIDSADHYFVIVGPANFTTPWRSWNNDQVVICDPWAEHCAVCNPHGIQTWFEKLKLICEPPFAPGPSFSRIFTLDTKASWKYKILP